MTAMPANLKNARTLEDGTTVGVMRVSGGELFTRLAPAKRPGCARKATYFMNAREITAKEALKIVAAPRVRLTLTPPVA